MIVERISATADDSPICITLFRAVDQASCGERHSGTWDELCAAFATPLDGHARKEDLPGYCLATFRGDTRSRPGIEFVSAIGLDIEAPSTIESAERFLEGLDAIISTTFSHTPDAHRLRGVVRTSRPMTAPEHDRVHEYLRRKAEAMGCALSGADAAKDASRFWFMPARPPNGHYECRVLLGAPLDVDAVLALVPAHQTDHFQYEFDKLDYQASSSKTNDEGLVQLKLLCESLKSLEVGDRHHGLYRAACDVAELVALGEVFQTDGLPSVSAEDAESALFQGVAAANWGDHSNDPETIRDGLCRGYSEAVPVIRLAQLPQTDWGNAKRFVTHWSTTVRYVARKRAWLIWTGKRWEWDHTDYHLELAKRTVRHIRREARIFPDDTDERKRLLRFAKASEAAARVEALVKLARVDPDIAVVADDLDKDPLLFNCANGTLDLRSGELRPHDPDHLVTMMSPVAYDLRVTPGLWAETIRKATEPDADLARYVQKLAGYSLTGLTREKQFWFLFGPPDALKSTVLEAIATVLGDYASAVDCQTWLKHAHASDNRGDLVRLRGKRLAYTVEFPVAATFDERLMKQWTGGDTFTGADKYEKHISFPPTAKLWFAANDPPLIGDSDEGMWKRCRRIPFLNVQLDIDMAAREKLRDPLVGGVEILRWMVEGLRMYFAEGLEPPAAVVTSTKQYRAEVDQVGRFLMEMCALEPTSRTRMSDLRDAFDAWRRDSGEKACPGGKNFNAKLRRAGLTEYKSGDRYWQGVRLLSASERGGLDSESADVRRSHHLIESLRNGGRGLTIPAAPASWPSLSSALQRDMVALARAIHAAGGTVDCRSLRGLFESSASSMSEPSYTQVYMTLQSVGVPADPGPGMLRLRVTGDRCELVLGS